MESTTSLTTCVRFHRSPIVLFFQFCQLLIIYSIGILALLVTRDLRDSLLTTPESIFQVYKIGGVVIGLEMIRRYFNELYIFGRSRIIHLRGILALNLQRVSISYRDVAEIRVDQTIWGRMFGYGTLQFSTPATDTREVTFEEIAFPESLSRRAELLVHEAQRFSPEMLASLE